MADAFSRVKSVLKNGSGKCVLLESGEARYVVMNWREYEELVNLIESLKAGEDIDITRLPL